MNVRRSKSETRVSEDHSSDMLLSRGRVSTIALLAITAISFYVCYLLALPFLASLAWALALAVIAHPMHAWIERRVRWPSLAAGISVAIIVLLILVPVIFVSHQVVNQINSTLEAIPKSLSGFAERYPEMRNIVHSFESGNVPAEIKQTMKEFASRVPVLVGGSIWAAAQTLITVFFLFYFLRDRRQWLDFIRRMMPVPEEESNFAFDRINRSIFATVYGSLTCAVVQGLLGGLIFWVLGLPAPLLWGIVMAVLVVIPVLGTFVVWFPAAVFLALNGHWVKAAILVAWGATAIGLIDNLLYPILVGDRLRMHPVPVFIAIVGGIAIFGAAGMVLGPVALATSEALLQVWKRLPQQT